MSHSTFLVPLVLGTFVIASAACGGEAPPPKPPEMPMEMSDAGETPEEMPPPAAGEDEMDAGAY